jgi:CRISPR-associated protein Cmr6
MRGYPLPGDVAEAVQGNPASNFGLFFHRLLPQDDKVEVWRQVVQTALDIFQSDVTQELWRAFQERMARLEEAYRRRWGPGGVIAFQGRVVERLAVGLGAPSVLETGIALHRVYGIPYLPGSAIKGLTRHYRLASIGEELGVVPLDPPEISRRRREKKKTPWEMLEELITAEEPTGKLEELYGQLATDSRLEDGPIKRGELSWKDLRQAHADFRRAFGSPARRGEVIFLDAFPVELVVSQDGQAWPILERDILNPHYSPYYTGGRPPADYWSPVPVYFLTVRPGTRFHFRLACRDSNLLSTVAGWLREALHRFGIGAKTGAGYGVLRCTNGPGSAVEVE